MEIEVSRQPAHSKKMEGVQTLGTSKNDKNPLAGISKLPNTFTGYPNIP